MRLTDAGNAERLLKLYGDDILYCPQMKAWYVWDGRKWVEDVHNGMYEMAVGVAQSYLKDADKYKADDKRHTRLVKWATVSENLPSIKAMINIAQSNPEICYNADELDHDPMLLNVLNGTIDLNTGKLHKFNPSDMITKIAPVTFVKGAKSTVWEKFMEDIIPDPDTRTFIQTAVGYSLTASTKEDKFFILYGGGCNGKTTFVNTILSIMGSYASQASSHTIIRKRDNGPRDDMFVLMGRRFVAATETGESHHLDENLMKQITGGNRISVNPKYRTQIEFQPTWKVWLDTNYEPKITGTDQAIWRRPLKIPFSVSIPDAKRDPNLKPYLASDRTEHSGILNWALEGVRMWKAVGLNPSQEIIDATKHYRSEQDLLGQFLSDCCQFHPQYAVSKCVIFDAFCHYCRQNFEVPRSKKAFGSQLLERGIKESRNAKERYWIGVKLDTSVNLHPSGFVTQ